MSSEAANDLVKALETLSLISEEQSRDLARARSQAADINEIFERRLTERLEGQRSPVPLPSELQFSETSRFSDQHSRLAQRESSFLSAFHALMRLYADDAIRLKAEKIFHLLGQIRLIDIGDDPEQFASHMPTLASSSEQGNPEDRKREMLGSLLEHHRGMKEFIQKRQETWDKQIERSDALLRQALAEARMLLP